MESSEKKKGDIIILFMFLTTLLIWFLFDFLRNLPKFLSGFDDSRYTKKEHHNLPVDPNNSPTPQLSVTIPALNEIKYIPSLLNSLRNQKTEYTYEIIVCDNGSTDGTFEFLQKQKDIKVVRQTTKGVALARNTAIKNSRADYIIQTDADCIVPYDWVQRMGDALIKEKRDFVSGSVYFEGNSFLQKIFASSVYCIAMPYINRMIKYVPERITYYRRFCSGANMGFSRKLFDVVGGYDITKNFLEDYDLGTKSMEDGHVVDHLSEIDVKTSARRMGNNIFTTVSYIGKAFTSAVLDDIGVKLVTEYERVD